MKRLTLWTLIAALAMAGAGGAAAKINVVASTTDLASIAQAVGGDAVDASSIARGTSDPHFVEVLPSYMVRVKKARVYLLVGMDLDRWAYPIIDGSRNGDLLVVDCSKGIPPLEVPTGKVDASMGDIHPRGNPHYWLDPDNGIIIASTIADALAHADPVNADRYMAGLDRFKTAVAERKTAWAAKAAPLGKLEVITFHNSWPYFCRAFGIDVVGFVEPLPGIEPTPSHTAQLVEVAKARGIRVIGVEPYFSKRTPETIARATGAKVVDLPPSVGGAPGADDYFGLFDVLIDRLLAEAR
jgi:ABC-type Zn uptake system ZnuABC Zn-binding protein ZnuA